MVEEILSNLYKIEIPLPKNPLKAINSYVIKNSGRNLIVDTGWNQKEGFWGRIFTLDFAYSPESNIFRFFRISRTGTISILPSCIRRFPV